MPVQCPFCSCEGIPFVKRRLSANGWVLFFVLLLFCIPLCWLPFVIDAMKEEVRRCGSCGMRLG